MKLRHNIGIAGGMLALSVCLIWAADQGRERKYQQAVDLYESKGDVKGAIKLFEEVAKSPDRNLTARSLFYLGECYEKLGQDGAQKAYERVVREFGDQADVSAKARVRLAAMGAEKTWRPTNTLVWGGDKIDDEGTVSFDGRYLSFTDWSTGDLALREIATGETRLLTHTGNAPKGKWKVFAEESAISRDGRQVAFSWYDEGTKRYDLRVVNSSGEPNPRRLYDDPGIEWLEPRDWSPDGKSIAVLISRKDHTDQMGLVSVADGSLRVLRSGTWSGDTRMFFSPDGKYLGYDLPENQAKRPRHVLVFDLNAGREVPVAVRRGEDLMVGWSPDGKRLLFASDRTGAMGLWSQPFGDGKPQGTPDLIKPDLGSIEPLGVTRSGALYYFVSSGGWDESTLRIGSFDIRNRPDLGRA